MNLPNNAMNWITAVIARIMNNVITFCSVSQSAGQPCEPHLPFVVRSIAWLLLGISFTWDLLAFLGSLKNHFKNQLNVGDTRTSMVPGPSWRLPGTVFTKEWSYIFWILAIISSGQKDFGFDGIIGPLFSTVFSAGWLRSCFICIPALFYLASPPCSLSPHPYTFVYAPLRIGRL